MKKKNVFIVICLLVIGISGVFQSTKADAALIGDDYPAKWKNLPLGATYDDWKYSTRYCTSFVANRLSKVNKFNTPSDLGNADTWASNAKRKGYTVNNVPKIGAVAQWNSMHVAWVADIKGDQILIEEYNYGFPSTGNYHTRWINKNDPDNYIHFKDIEVQVPMPTGKTTVTTEGSIATITSTLNGTAEQLAAVKKVEYPTWSGNNGSNKIWHAATKINATTYQARVDLNVYKQYGKYYTHSYVTMSDGRQNAFATNEYNLNAPIFPTGTTTAELEGNTVILTSTLTGTPEQLSAVKKIEYPTWSGNNGSNKIWHAATKINATTYQARVDLNVYKQYGKYYTHSYITNKDGYQKAFATNEYELIKQEIPTGTTTAELEGNTVILTSTLTGTPEQLAAVQKVEYPTWSGNDGSNKIWHAATKINATTYQARVDLNVYKQYGKYYTHSYVTMSDGRQNAFATNEYELIKQEIPTGTTTAEVEGNTVILTSTLTGTPEQLAAVKKVEYPTWSGNNGSYKIWHAATKINDTTYQARVDLSVYKQYGKYYTHSYVTMSDGRQNAFTTNEYELIKQEIPTGTTTAEVEGNTVILTSTLTGTPEQLAAVQKVEYPTWSGNNGSYKIWHAATKINDTTYQARVDLSVYKQYGKYYTHSYVTMSDGRQNAFATNEYELIKL